MPLPLHSVSPPARPLEGGLCGAAEPCASTDENNERGVVCNGGRVPDAARNNDWESVRVLLYELGPSAIDCRDDTGSNLLHWAIRYGKTRLMKELLEEPKMRKHINVNAADNNGTTLIMLAVRDPLRRTG